MSLKKYIDFDRVRKIDGYIYWWIKKSSDRVDKLKKENRVDKDIPFHENITEEEMDNWLSSRVIN